MGATEECSSSDVLRFFASDGVARAAADMFVVERERLNAWALRVLPKPHSSGVCDRSYHMLSDVTAYSSTPTMSIRHEQYTDRWHCEDCDRSFKSRDALNQHLDKSNSHCYCFACERDFVSVEARRQHWLNSGSHNFCSDCDEDFDDFDELEDHYREEHHFCEPCSEVFWSSEDLEEHYDDEHFYCAPCNRFFQNQHNLDAHLNSSIHKPRNVRCPMRGCSSTFLSHSGVILHWESDKCSSGITRAMIDRYAVEHDVHNYITKPRRMITGGPRGGYPFTEERKYMASEAAWNGRAYECYLCHQTFAQLQSLNSHLASSRHSGSRYPIYHCPPGGCETQFRTCSALVQHIESGICGVGKFKGVGKAIDNILRGGKKLIQG